MFFPLLFLFFLEANCRPYVGTCVENIPRVKTIRESIHYTTLTFESSLLVQKFGIVKLVVSKEIDLANG